MRNFTELTQMTTTSATLSRRTLSVLAFCFATSGCLSKATEVAVDSSDTAADNSTNGAESGQTGEADSMGTGSTTESTSDSATEGGSAESDSAESGSVDETGPSGSTTGDGDGDGDGDGNGDGDGCGPQYCRTQVTLATEVSTCLFDLDPAIPCAEWARAEFDGQDSPVSEDCDTEAGWMFEFSSCSDPERGHFCSQVRLCGAECDRFQQQSDALELGIFCTGG